jgi:hypothetical protein
MLQLLSNPTIPPALRIAQDYPADYPDTEISGETIVDCARRGDDMVFVLYDDSPHCGPFDMAFNDEPVAVFERDRFGGGMFEACDNSKRSHNMDLLYEMWRGDIDERTDLFPDDEGDEDEDYMFESQAEYLAWRLTVRTEEVSHRDGSYLVVWYVDEFAEYCCGDRRGRHSVTGEEFTPCFDAFSSVLDGDVYGYVRVPLKKLFIWDSESGDWEPDPDLDLYGDATDSCWGFIGEPGYCLEEGCV